MILDCAVIYHKNKIKWTHEGIGRRNIGRQNGTIIVEATLGVVADGEVNVDIVHLLVDLLRGPESHPLLCHFEGKEPGIGTGTRGWR